MKSVSGNSKSLCVDCTGENTVPNNDRSGCGKYERGQEPHSGTSNMIFLLKLFFWTSDLKSQT